MVRGRDVLRDSGLLRRSHPEQGTGAIYHRLRGLGAKMTLEVLNVQQPTVRSVTRHFQPALEIPRDVCATCVLGF